MMQLILILNRVYRSCALAACVWPLAQISAGEKVKIKMFSSVC